MHMLPRVKLIMVLFVAAVAGAAERPEATEISAKGVTQGATPPTPPAIPNEARDVLNMGSFWRWYLVLRKPTISVEQLKLAGRKEEKPLPLKGKQRRAPYTAVDQYNGPTPPTGWERADFDDSNWPRGQPSVFRRLVAWKFSSFALRLRGKFSVSDVDAVKGLYLNLGYYGGAVVYLNGKEVARAHLPKGSSDLNSLAEAYPLEAHVDASGAPIPNLHKRYTGKLSPQKVKDLKSRVAKRRRSIGSVKLPRAALKKGINVLAIEIRRSHYPAVAPQWFSGKYGKSMPSWVPLQVHKLELKATGKGINFNRNRPGALQVWVEDRIVRITPQSVGDPNEEQPMKVVGARNGTFCGQVVVRSKQAVKGLKASVGALRLSKGDGEISASQIKVLFGRLDVSFYGVPPWFDGLKEKPGVEVPVHKKYGSAVQPILVRIHVPADAKPGDYRSQLTIAADGIEPVQVPFELSVADWAIPNPADYRTYVGIYQSPTSVALQYKLKMWSEEHWQHLEKSFELLARAGNKMVNIPVVDQTQFGNAEGFVFWIKKDDGSYEYDLSVLERYLKLAKKHCGTLDYVALQIWHAGGWKHRGADQKNTVTVIEKKTGQRSHMQVPKFDGPEARAFWKPALDAIQTRLTALGLQKAMCIGILSDSTAPPEVFKMFDEVLPPTARWHRGCHIRPRHAKPYRANGGGGRVVLHEHCYGLKMADPDGALPNFWALRGRPGTAYDRISNHERYMSLGWYRNTAMLSIFRCTQGVGRVCLDFWPVLKSGRSKKWIYNRYPHSSCGQRRPSMQKMTWPGPGGAATSLRFEAFLEGIQDAEAVMFVSKAMAHDAEKLGKELEAECRVVLADLMRSQYGGSDRGPLRPVHYGWQELSRRLYACAAKVAKAKGKAE